MKRSLHPRPTVTFVVDIGNSAVKWAVFEAGEPVRSGRIDHGAFAHVQAWLPILASECRGARDAAVVSVVPELSTPVLDELARCLGRAPLRIDATIRLPFAMGYRTPSSLGADRMAAAAGAVERLSRTDRPDRGLVVVDAGTALTVDLVDRERVYLGGAIAPGPRLLAAALRRGTAQLPEVGLDWPVEVIGRTTDESIRAGVLHGFVAAAEGLIARVAASSGGEAYVVATGGWAHLLAGETHTIDEVCPDLVLRGAALLSGLNRD